MWSCIEVKGDHIKISLILALFKDNMISRENDPVFNILSVDVITTIPPGPQTSASHWLEQPCILVVLYTRPSLVLALLGYHEAIVLRVTILPQYYIILKICIASSLGSPFYIYRSGSKAKASSESPRLRSWNGENRPNIEIAVLFYTC